MFKIEDYVLYQSETIKIIGTILAIYTNPIGTIVQLKVDQILWTCRRTTEELEYYKNRTVSVSRLDFLKKIDKSMVNILYESSNRG